jgi:uncharacterized membrane protein YciS (DUF1049 family)
VLSAFDDTLLFLKKDLGNVINLKWILSCFEQMSGMRINFHKCDLIAINVEEEEAQTVAQSLCCRLGQFPLKYLALLFNIGMFISWLMGKTLVLLKPGMVNNLELALGDVFTMI